MSEESKASICLSKARMSKRERERHMLVARVLSVWWDCLEVLMEPVFIVVEHDCRSLFVGVVVAFVDNSRFVDNSWELIDNVRDKHLLIDAIMFLLVIALGFYSNERKLANYTLKFQKHC